MPANVSIGLDIGSVAIRAIEVTNTKDQPVLESFGQALLPTGAVVGGVVRDERAVSTALRHLWSAHKFRTKNVRLSVTHQQVVVREVELPNLPAKEMRLALPFQARDVLALPTDQAILDFFPLEPTAGENGKQAAPKETVRGLLIGAPKEAVIDRVRAVEKAGLRVDRVDLACFAVCRAVAAASRCPEAVVDIGANATLVVIHNAGIPEVIRTIPRGGDEITKALSTRLNVNMPDAEKLKCTIGAREPSDHDEETQESEAADVINEALRPLVSEIRSSVAYYVNGAPGRTVGRIALVGGGAQLPGLRDMVGEAVGVPAFIADPLQYISHRNGGRHDLLGRYRASAAVSIGLVLGAA